MPVKFACAHCAKKINAPDAAAGKKSKCPACDKPVKVPGGTSFADFELSDESREKQSTSHSKIIVSVLVFCILAVTATWLIFREKQIAGSSNKGSAATAQSKSKEADAIDLTTHAFCDELNPAVVRDIAFNGYRVVGMPTADRGASALQREEYNEQLRMQPLLQAQHKAEVELRAAKMSSIVAGIRAAAGTPNATNDQAIMIGRKHAEIVIARLKAIHADTTVDETKVSDAIREAHRQAIAEARNLLKK